MGRMAYAVGRASRGGSGLTGTAPHAMPRTRSRPERGRQGHPLREGWIRTGPEQADTAIHAGRLVPGNARRRPDAKRAGGRRDHPLPGGWPDTERVWSRQARRLTPGNSRRATRTGQRTPQAGREAGRGQAGSPAPRRLARYGTGPEQAGCGDSRRAVHAASRARNRPGAGRVTRSGGWPDTERVRSRQAAATHAGQFTPQAGRETDRGQAGLPAPGGWPDTERIQSRQPGSPP